VNHDPRKSYWHDLGNTQDEEMVGMKLQIVKHVDLDYKLKIRLLLPLIQCKRVLVTLCSWHQEVLHAKQQLQKTNP